jgi:hypothetical protein
VAHLQFTQATTQTKNCKRATSQPAKTEQQMDRQRQDRKNNEGITAPTRNWRFSAPQTHLWLIKVWFSASTFVVKIANFL